MLASLYEYRSLLSRFVRREVSQRYVGSLLGIFWSVVYPLILLGVYTLVFGAYLKARWEAGGDTFSFALNVFCGLLPWQMFSECLLRGASSLVENANIVKKTAFPKELIPASIVLSAFFHQLVGTTLFFIVLVAGGRAPGVHILILPVVMALQLIGCLGMAWVASVANAIFRDVGHLLGAACQVWFFLTPIVYPVGKLPDWVKPYARLNPVMHLVEAYRDPLLDGRWFKGEHLLGLAIWAGASLALGILLFRRAKPTISDWGRGSITGGVFWFPCVPSIGDACVDIGTIELDGREEITVVRYRESLEELSSGRKRGFTIIFRLDSLRRRAFGDSQQ
jgi:lipopolysaccharide transport system permease protein